MRRPALLTATALGALVTAVLVAQPGVANAADTTVDAAVFDYRTSWVGADEVAIYPGTGAFPEGWSSLAAAPTFSADGAGLGGGGLLVHATTGLPASDLAEVSGRASAGGGDDEQFVATGDAHYALVLDAGGSADNTDPIVLTTLGTGPTAIDGDWIATEDIGFIQAGDRENLNAFRAQLALEDPDTTINAYGVQATTTSADVVGITWQGDTSFFTPRPTGSAVVPTPLTLSAFQTTGVEIEATGFKPRETVRVSMLLPDAETPPADQTFTADDDGAVSGTVTGSILPFDTELTLLVEGTTSAVGVGFPLDVVADPAVAPAPAPGTTPAPAPAAPVATPVTGTATFTG